MYEELVKRLKDRAERFDYDGWVDTAIVLEQAADAIESMREMVATAYEENANIIQSYEDSKPRWIPVTGEAPLEVGDDGYNGYLVYANGYYAIADYTTDKLDFVPYFYVNGEYEPNVTHWMPLPEPPKEDKE